MLKIFRLQKTAYLLSVLLLAALHVSAQTKWPVEIAGTDGSRITVYEPEPEKFTDNRLYARAAVSIRKKSGEEPVFGVMWLNAVLQPDGQRRSGILKTVTVAKSKFADDDDAGNSILRNAVERNMPGLNIQFDLNRIASELDKETFTGDNNFRNDAPLILYRNKPTTLIVLDGEPIEQQDEDLNMTRVVNSPYLILKNQDDRKYYLYGGSFWYSSASVKNGWVNISKLPAKIKAVDTKMKQQEKEAAEEKDETSQFTSPTDILVTTEPAELIQTEGAPTYKAVPGSTLLYVDNSLDEIFKDIESQKNYILIAGRWYSSASLSGPWAYIPQENLPAAFAAIPRGSEKDGVLASVAGTDEAEEAMMDARIPQTAKVDRNSAECQVYYDGEPRFAPIANTNLSVAENSDLTVMLAPNNRYYALENGIWFISNSAYGPWQVANERPSDVDRIPASSSAYNARFVQIYEITPQYVYVGYTPGYMGNYIYRNTVVWGTGYRYRPWYGRRYYARPHTWGFGMHYNPWNGWSISFGLGFNTGWYRYSRHHRPGGGWFGPPMYRPPHRPWGWNGGYYGSRPNRPQYRPNVVANRPPNYNTRQPSRFGRPANIYDNRKNVVTRDKIQRPASRPGSSYTRPGTNPGTRPGTPDTRPGTRPSPVDRPGTRPTSPVGRPSSRPATPVERPGIRPTIPAERPATRPAIPAERPGSRPAAPGIERPDIRPANPVERPTSRPSVNPVERPAAQPRPAQPAQRPASPVTRPVQRPAQRTERPANIRQATPENKAPANRETKPTVERPPSRSRNN